MTSKPSRYSRDEFLARSLDVLSQEGEEELRIDRLVSQLGVTKGSFYWHFENRADFVRSLADFWARSSTQVVIDDIELMAGSPEDRLFSLMKRVSRQDLAGHDLAMRTWASHEPEVALFVRKVDRLRLTFVRGLFKEMGYEGGELETRTRIFVTATSLQRGILVREPKDRRLESLRQWHDFFTRP
ncbi:MAG: TetR family transcriptional regulator [Bacteroidia bacterium]|nr:TetR family transcriptional regulator [Bacteroidia bacterium]